MLLDLVVQSPISANPGLTPNKTKSQPRLSTNQALNNRFDVIVTFSLSMLGFISKSLQDQCYVTPNISIALMPQYKLIRSVWKCEKM